MIRCFYTEVSVKANISGSIKNECELLACATHEKSNAVGLRVTLGSKRGDCPLFAYEINVHIVGQFESVFPTKMSKKKRDYFVKSNGAGVLFGMARDMITTITSKQAHGSIVLPIVQPAYL